jgi:hypothetical protein
LLNAKEEDMGCLICENLKRIYEARLGEYVEAVSSECYRINKKVAAHKNVEMERAKYELEEHRSVCLSNMVVPALLPQREVAVRMGRVAA